jgi:DNA polymerase-3 subunit epsilon
MPLSPAVDPQTPLHELEYAVVDVETTGTAAGRSDRVTEIAAVVLRGTRIAGELATLVNPGRGIPPAIVRLTGITNAMVARAPSFGEVAADFGEVLHGRVFVAHNAAFDWAFVRDELARAAVEVPEVPRLCTVRIARRVLAHLPRRNLDAVAAHYGERFDARHRALGDARVTARVFSRMLDELGARGVHTWRDLDEFLRGGRRTRSALPAPITDWRIA